MHLIFRINTIIIIALGLLFSQVCAQQISFDHVGIKQGLSDEYIEDICIDSFGYIWIATLHGLNRYDGTECKSYHNIKHDSISLNHVNTVYLDAQGQLLIGTKRNGILRYDYSTDSFEQTLFKTKNNTDQLFKNSIRQLYEDRNNNLWCVASYGIAQRKKGSKEWKWYEMSTDSVPLTKKYAYTIYETAQSKIFAGYIEHGKLFYYNDSLDQFSTLQLPPSDFKNVTSIVEDSLQNLWFGTTENGLFCFNQKTNTIRQFTASANEGALHSNDIKYLFIDNSGAIWVGTINGGLYLYSAQTDSFTNYTTNNSSISSNSISKIVQDESGNYCIATHHGLNIINYRKNLFKHIYFNKNASGHSKEIVSAFYQQNKNEIWIGTDGNGLSKLDVELANIKHIDPKTPFASNSILAIEPNGDGKLWIAFWAGGISLYDIKTNTNTNFVPENSALNNPNIKGLLKDGRYLWIATHGKGINILDTEKHIIYNSSNPSEKFNFDMGKPTWANSIYKDTYGNMWITTTVGLYRFDGEILHEYLPDNTDPKSVSGLNISQVFQDSNGDIWIGSSGLDQYIPELDGFVHLNDSVPNMPQVVNAITEDDLGNLWLSSNDGLYWINSNKTKVSRYTTSDGLSGNKFVERSCMKTDNGFLFFGSYAGFEIFSPSKITENCNIPPIRLSAFKVLDVEQSSFKNDAFWKEYRNYENLQIPYNESKLISISFNSITLNAPDQISYSVKLEGFETEFREMGSHNNATYTNLAPGSYTLQVESIRNNCKEHIAQAEFSFAIIAPWWMTLEFKILACLAIILLTLAIIKWRTLILTKQKQALERKVAIRTAVIQDKNKALQDSISTRDKLLGIISHDLKNPLMSLMHLTSTLYDSLSEGKDDKKKNVALSIRNSVNSMQKQVVDLLDWALAQSGKLQCRPEEINIKSCIADSVMFMTQNIQQKQIEITLDINSTRTVIADTRMLGTIITNIISNSIKFTQEEGKITIKVQNTDEFVEISITDTGIGMPEEKITQILQNTQAESTTGTAKEKGTGLGLNVCTEFIRLNNGSFTIQSTIGMGTTATITLPAGNTIDSTRDVEIKRENTNSKKQHSEKSQHILIIEDNKDMMDILEGAFDPYFEIHKAFNGVEGLELAIETVPDIILTDIEMPLMNGTELCIQLKLNRITSHIPIIIISAQNSVFEQIEGLKLGVDDYITKPFNVSVLTTKVLSLLQNRSTHANLLRKKFMTEPEEIELESEEEKFVKRLIDCINSNIDSDKLNVDFLAKNIGYSRTQLYRKTTAALNQTPVELIRKTRLQKAAKMLETNKFKIAEIAYAVGFNTPKYFSTCFFEEFNMTPTDYMKKASE